MEIWSMRNDACWHELIVTWLLLKKDKELIKNNTES